MTLTDKLTVLIAPFSTFVFWASGSTITGSVQEALAVAVALTVLVVAILRMCIAPYWLWRDDQAEKAKLRDALDEEKAKPDRYEREMAATHTIRLRAELIDVLAKSVAIAELCAMGKEKARLISDSIEKDFSEQTKRSRQLINALSYDIPLRVCAYHLSVLCANISTAGLHGEKIGDNWDKLQSLKKMVFRVLHKKEPNEQCEIITMLQVQNLMGDKHASDSVAEEDDSIDILRKMLADPKLAERLRTEMA